MAVEIKKKMLGLIDRWSKEQLDFLISLCNENSYTFHKKGTDRVATLILERLQDFFPIYRKMEQNETGDHHILKTKDTGKAIYLLGHLDTVFPPDHPFQACRRESEWLMGPGTADMKGGLAVMVYVLRALHQVGILENLNVAVVLGADEENGSAASQKIYEKERQIASICLAAECAGENGEVVVSRNGKAGGRLECTGRDRHVGSEGEEKASAVLEIAKKVIAFESLNAQFPEVRVNVGRIEGGLGPSTIPAQASFLFDLRWEKEQHYAPLLERLQEIASRSDNPLCKSKLTLLNHRPAMPADKKTYSLFSRLQKTSVDLGQNLSTEYRRGTSDANYFGAVGVPTLDGFGPIGVRDHTPEERILISSLKDRTALLACFLLDLKEEPH
ncbi:MAG: M20/M25/M40 family metallo-hydrolase [Candidatus Aminicenantes bacterium]|nr:M20/M25/M40 family metallo-hydrolase [Candidatus Aminicenantes bacterium]